MAAIDIIWREATVRSIDSQFTGGEPTSTMTVPPPLEARFDPPPPGSIEWSDDREIRRQPPRLCLIGVRVDGTRQCLLGGLLSFDQAARARIIMRESHGYVEFRSIRIARDDRVRERFAVGGH